MKKILILAALVIAGIDISAQQMKVITVVESIVPMGLGRSRMIEHQQAQDPDALTTERTEGTDSNQGKIKRKDIKIDEFSETKLLNFFSGVGINFQNIASNDAVITAKINQMIDEGWELAFVTSAVESEAGAEDPNGIFITRLFFRKTN